MPKSNKTRLLYVMYGWNETGGGTTLPKALAKNFAEDGFEISIFYASLKSNPAMPPYSLEKHEEDGITLYGLYNRPAIFTDANNPDREVLDPNIDARFSEVLDEVQPDVIHFHNFHGMTMSIAHIARERGIPSCFTPHNLLCNRARIYTCSTKISNSGTGVDMRKFILRKGKIRTNRRIPPADNRCAPAFERGNRHDALRIEAAARVVRKIWN